MILRWYQLTSFFYNKLDINKSKFKFYAQPTFNMFENMHPLETFKNMFVYFTSKNPSNIYIMKNVILQGALKG